MYIAAGTGPQYGIDDRLRETDTPFWTAEVSLRAGGGRSIDGRFGLEVTGEPVSFCGRTLPTGVYDARHHMVITQWIQDSVLGVLAHNE